MARSGLTALEQGAWGGLLETHSAFWRELERRLVKSHGMALSTYDVLVRLDRSEACGLRMSALARQVLMSSGGVTRLVDRLEEDGLVCRERSTEDLRGFEVRITPAGRKALASASRQHLEDVRELFLCHLTEDELELLAGIWRRLRTPE